MRRSYGSRAVRTYHPRGLDHRGLGPAAEALEPRRLLAASVLTYHNDIASTGQNLAETILTPANVNARTFGKLFTTPLDGQVYAQPLYVPGVTITPGDRASTTSSSSPPSTTASTPSTPTPAPCSGRTASSIPPAGVTTVPDADVGTQRPRRPRSASPARRSSTRPQAPSTSSPRPRRSSTGSTHYVQTLHALDLGSGAEKLGGPAVIADTIVRRRRRTPTSAGPSVNGNGDGSVNGRGLLQRPAAEPAVGADPGQRHVYIASASHGDNGPYHGWVLGYNADDPRSSRPSSTPRPTAATAASGRAAAGSPSTRRATSTSRPATAPSTPPSNANGFPSQRRLRRLVLKLAVDPTTTAANQNINGWGLKVVDYFTPFNQATSTSTTTSTSAPAGRCSCPTRPATRPTPTC